MSRALVRTIFGAWTPVEVESILELRESINGWAVLRTHDETLMIDAESRRRLKAMTQAETPAPIES
jgi:hypothetical protein